MAWTAPRTWIAAEIPGASTFNTHVRDNFLETAPAKVSAASQLVVSTAANTLTARSPNRGQVLTSETTASTSYTDLATAGPSVSVGTGTSAVVWLTAQLSNNTAGGLSIVAVEVFGATAVSASDDNSVVYESGAAGDTSRNTAAMLFSTLTAGTNGFRAKYRVTAGTGTFQRRTLVVFPL